MSAIRNSLALLSLAITSMLAHSAAAQEALKIETVRIETASTRCTGSTFLVTATQIFRCNADGTDTLIAGLPISGVRNGDGGPAVKATFANISGVVHDKRKNILYVADRGAMRKVDLASGIISVVIENAGNAWPAALDAEGNLFFSDGLGRIIRIDAATDGLSYFAGNSIERGFAGDGGPASEARFSGIRSITFDKNQNMYLTDSGNNRIRRIDRATNIITTIAGGDSALPFEFDASYGDNLPAPFTALDGPSDFKLDAQGNGYIVEFAGGRLRKMDAQTGVITTLLKGPYNALNIQQFSAQENCPVEHPNVALILSVTPTENGDLLVYERNQLQQRLRKITRHDGKVSRAVGGIWSSAAGENGWGLQLFQHCNVVTGIWNLQDESGKPTWYLLGGGSWSADFSKFTAPLFQPKGPVFSNYTAQTAAAQFQPGAAIGSVTFELQGKDTALLSYNINNVSGGRSLQRMDLGQNAPSKVDFADAWWSASCDSRYSFPREIACDKGWGLGINQGGSTLVANWYTYGPDNRPVWYILNGGSWIDAKTYKGQLITASGPATLTGSYDPAAVNTRVVGEMTLSFSESTLGTMTYTVDGITQTKSIYRMRF